MLGGEARPGVCRGDEASGKAGGPVEAPHTTRQPRGPGSGGQHQDRVPSGPASTRHGSAGCPGLGPHVGGHRSGLREDLGQRGHRGCAFTSCWPAWPATRATLLLLATVRRAQAVPGCSGRSCLSPTAPLTAPLAALMLCLLLDPTTQTRTWNPLPSRGNWASTPSRLSPPENHRHHHRVSNRGGRV